MTLIRNRLSLAIVAILFNASLSLALNFDQNVTPDVIFGSGNANGGFTTDVSVAGDIELGLRTKLRFNAMNQPENTFNSNGDGSYTFQAGNPPTGFSFAANSPTTPVWNFEWSINTNVNGSGQNLAGYVYELGLDGDPTSGTNFETFDPINLPAADHALGDNTTPNGGGTSDLVNYVANTSLFNVAQNSWSYEFFNDAPSALSTFDPTVPGTYDIYLSVSDPTGSELARSSITVNVVPEPSGLALSGFILLGMFVRQRRR